VSRTSRAPSVLVTKSEAARILGVSRDTVYRLQAQGLLRDVVVPGMEKPRLRRDDVLALAKGERP
jgi:excisionase family DNA binding protein